jgi:hypothetical protein
VHSYTFSKVASKVSVWRHFSYSAHGYEAAELEVGLAFAFAFALALEVIKA